MLKLQIFETEHYVRDDTGKVYIVVHWTMLVTPYILVWHTSLVDVLKIFHDADISVFVDGNYQTFRSEVVSPFSTSASDSMLWHSNDNITMIKDRLDPIAAIDYIDNSTENQCTRKAFSKLFVCPLIEIGLNEISFKQNETFLIIGDTDRPIVLADWQYVMTNGSLQVCVDDFQIISNSMHWHSIRDEVDHEIISTSQILSFACVCTSLFCLLVTIVTYAVTPEMRTQPGINNIILCVSLLLAQTVYQFGAAQTAYVSSFSCSFIGAICHFLWLCVIFSMNNCSIQMFRIFKRSVLVAPQFSWISTAKSILYITCMSLSFVVIAVTISLSLSNGRNSGYGGSICFLSDYLMHTVTFMIPTALIIVLNIVLFGYVVFVIYKSNEEAARLRQERSYFGVYVRLSTLTGLTWVFGYLYLFLKFNIIEYFFIVFNGLQGVFSCLRLL